MTMSPDGMVFILVDNTSLPFNMASIQCDVIPAQNCSIRRLLSGLFIHLSVHYISFL